MGRIFAIGGGLVLAAGLLVFGLVLWLLVTGIPYPEWVRLQKSRRGQNRP